MDQLFRTNSHYYPSLKGLEYFYGKVVYALVRERVKMVYAIVTNLSFLLYESRLGYSVLGQQRGRWIRNEENRLARGLE